MYRYSDGDIPVSEINLVPAERRRLSFMRIKKRVKEKFFGKYFSDLWRFGLISENYSGKVNELGDPLGDGTYSLTLKYRRYRVYRNMIFMNGSVWPCIVSAIVSAIVSWIAARFICL